MALAWCLQRDGRPLPSNPVASQSYLHYGTPVETPRLGDICIFTDVEDASIGHVGLFVGFAGADKVTVLGGNQKISLPLEKLAHDGGQMAIDAAWPPLQASPSRDPIASLSRCASASFCFSSGPSWRCRAT